MLGSEDESASPGDHESLSVICESKCGDEAYTSIIGEPVASKVSATNVC